MKKTSSNTPLHKRNAFSESRAAAVIFSLISLGFVYVFASLAIDTGALLHYAMGLVWAVAAVYQLTRVLRRKKKPDAG